MNDFTKEELQLIIMAISDLVIINDEDSEKSPLFGKIQSLIDTYCDHYPESIREASALGYIVKQYKHCGKIYI